MLEFLGILSVLWPLPIGILTLWLSISEESRLWHRLCNSTIVKILCAACIQSLYTSLHHTTILGVPHFLYPPNYTNERNSKQLRLISWHSAFNLGKVYSALKISYKRGGGWCESYMYTCRGAGHMKLSVWVICLLHVHMARATVMFCSCISHLV